MGNAAPGLNYREYVNAYKGWVFACVQAISEEIATIDLHLMHKTTKRSKDFNKFERELIKTKALNLAYIEKLVNIEEVDNHEALDLLNKVNDHMTRDELILATASFTELTGDAFWYVVPNASGKPQEIWPLDPTRVEVVKDRKTFISGYVYRNDKLEKIPLTTSEVIFFKRFNPKDPYRGMGTVQAAALAIDTDNYSAEWNRNFFYNSARPDIALKTEGTLTDEQYKRIRESWNQKHQGLDNAHKAAILEGGLSIEKLNLSQKDMDFLEQRRFTRDEILAIFKVPKTALMITEDVNRANAEATDYVFSKRVIKPRMKFIADRLTEFYLPLFGLSTTEYFFTFSDPVPENVELEIKEEQAGLASGWYAPNEVRAKKGLPPVENGDQVYLPVNLMPIGGVEPQKGVGGGTEMKEYQKSEGMVARRSKFISSEIKKRRGEFRDFLMEQKEYLLRKLKGSKGIKKGAEEELIALLLGTFSADWLTMTRDKVKETLETSFIFGGKQALSQVGVNIGFDLSNPRAKDWLEKNALEHATSINDTVKDQVKQRIVSGVEQGLSANDLADSISEFFDKQGGWRALRMARTEVIGGYSGGSLEGYKQSEVVKMKRWLTAGGVDDVCGDNEAQGVLRLEDAFASGDDAPPAHPNCKCVLIPEV